MDAVINHTGPVDAAAIRRGPTTGCAPGPNCTYRSYATTVDCTLVATLPDIRTESERRRWTCPPWLVEKWRREGRLDAERASLDSFFTRTGYPRAPALLPHQVAHRLGAGVRLRRLPDGHRQALRRRRSRVELKQEADRAFADWKRGPPGEGAGQPARSTWWARSTAGTRARAGRTATATARWTSSPTATTALINFAFKRDAAGPLDSLYDALSAALHGGALHGVSILNYVSSHDDGAPYDPDRKDPFGAGTRLLLAPGGAQIYYGDETARPLRVAGRAGRRQPPLVHELAGPGAGDSTTRGILEHWRKLGEFRRAHPAVGAGVHRTLQAQAVHLQPHPRHRQRRRPRPRGDGPAEGRQDHPRLRRLPRRHRCSRTRYSGDTATVTKGDGLARHPVRSGAAGPGARGAGERQRRRVRHRTTTRSPWRPMSSGPARTTAWGR